MFVGRVLRISQRYSPQWCVQHTLQKNLTKLNDHLEFSNSRHANLPFYPRSNAKIALSLQNFGGN